MPRGRRVGERLFIVRSDRAGGQQDGPGCHDGRAGHQGLEPWRQNRPLARALHDVPFLAGCGGAIRTWSPVSMVSLGLMMILSVDSMPLSTSSYCPRSCAITILR